MEKEKFIYWQDGAWWLGYLLEYPDYLTQGKSFTELKENLKDLYYQLSGSHGPNVRKIGELEIS